MRHGINGKRVNLGTLGLILLMTGCGGTKVLKEPLPFEVKQPLAVANSDYLTASLEFVVVRDGPGTWARNADWDEYLIRIDNHSNAELQILGVAVYDHLGTEVLPETRRKKLVKASKKTVKRYKGEDLQVKAGVNSGVLIATGAAVTAAGVAASYGAAMASLSGATAVTGGAAAAVSGVVLLGPALAVGGIVRAVNNNKVEHEISRRQNSLPLAVAAGGSVPITAFFPLAPSPRRVQVWYSLSGLTATVNIDTARALDGLHLRSVED